MALTAFDAGTSARFSTRTARALSAFLALLLHSWLALLAFTLRLLLHSWLALLPPATLARLFRPWLPLLAFAWSLLLHARLLASALLTLFSERLKTLPTRIRFIASRLTFAAAFGFGSGNNDRSIHRLLHRPNRIHDKQRTQCCCHHGN